MRRSRPLGVHTGRGRRDARWVRRRRASHGPDRLAVAMLVGAGLGFVIGALTGLNSTALDAPVLSPFIGAAVGVLVAALVVGALGLSASRERGRLEATRRERGHTRQRAEAHRGWVDGIDLTAEAPQPRRPTTTTRRDR